ncbi:mitochondrial 2-oxodicarboxylate carrier-like [Lytechinus variegatus]|uniref:mitochondrial 2-oxodicarboxylate carrier-like n=1 Tax=Lytechinus variegatus TaxID=7654 RepID=UPI001BB144B8|nr:mitochondrial 2-oxodicarboxylate carrier-like [Lytechinus variegatus]XP_041469676.1 mitochondrial 2-oxodicarboxylate carrier-like [Lytechinus variegatus]XP_054759066.1 mitochondrial 2-oxodicarboxylate carrier-like [Lytechinus pictus]
MGRLKEAGQQITAGGSAGLVEVSIMHPLDVIKTRFQIQGAPNSTMKYNGMWDCVKQMTRTEGTLSLYKGILPPIMAETPKRATKFFTFEQYKKIFLFGSPSPTALTFTLAGLCSGLTEGVLINPFEVVKVRLQADQNTFKKQPSAFGMARHVIRTDGFGSDGLFRGLTATLGRHGVFNMIYFSFYHNIKDLIPSSQDPRLEFGRKFVIGLMAGCLGSTINIPFDVAKSRIQGPQPVPGEVKYKGCFRTIAMVYREEGFFALYRGLLPKIMRLGPGGAIMLLVYDHVYTWLKQNT